MGPVYRQKFRITLIIISLVALFGGCAQLQSSEPTQVAGSGSATEKTPKTLRVEISANAPPMAYKTGAKLQGLEVDFAYKLGEYLGKKVRFVQTKWENQIPSLEQNKQQAWFKDTIKSWIPYL